MAGIKLIHATILPGATKVSDAKRKDYLAKAAKRAITLNV
jgi:hypothetical protein